MFRYAAVEATRVSRDGSRRSSRRAWLAYIRVQLRMNYEMHRQLQVDSGLSLSDYDILVALSNAPHARMRVADLAAQIGWERSRVSHQLRAYVRAWPDRTSDPRPTTVGPPMPWLTASGRQGHYTKRRPGHVELVQRLFFDAISRRTSGSTDRSVGNTSTSTSISTARWPPIPN